MSKILFITDYPIGSSYRGAEANDAIIYAEIKPDFQTCQEFNENPRIADSYIVSNFVSLSEDSKEILAHRGNYKIIHHDFLICPFRDPGAFPDFKIPQEHLINLDFIKAAECNFFQSGLQRYIFELNNVEGNFDNLAGNLWTRESLEMMVELSKNKKNGRAAIIDDPYKATEVAVEFCQGNFIPFDKIPKMSYVDFLSKLSEYSLFCFKPTLIETFNRILIESKVLQVVPITSQFCGAVHEDLWNYNGEDLAEKLNEKREEILTKLKA
jgi:hypothetical protein